MLRTTNHCSIFGSSFLYVLFFSLCVVVLVFWCVFPRVRWVLLVLVMDSISVWVEELLCPMDTVHMSTMHTAVGIPTMVMLRYQESSLVP